MKDMDLFDCAFSSFRILKKLNLCEQASPVEQQGIEEFQKLQGQVEIFYNNQSFQIKFKKPFYSNFINEKELAEEIIEKTSNTSTYTEKIEKFIRMMPIYKYKMIQSQRFSNFSLIRFLTKNESTIYHIRFTLVLILNVLIVSCVQYDEGDVSLQRSEFLFSLVRKKAWFLFLYILLTVFIYFFIIIEIFVKSLNQRAVLKGKRAIKKIRQNKLVTEDFIKKKPKSKISVLFKKLSQIKLWNIILLCISIIAFPIPFLWGFVLLDIITKSKEMSDIVSSITMNIQALLKTLYLALVIMYFYAFLSFTYFPSYYLHDESTQYKMYCYNLVSCYVSSVYNGIRSGGIGNALGQIGRDDELYWFRVFYDFSYFVLVIVCLLNIVFGIIIDTFADLRDKRNNLQEIKKTKCYICEAERYKIESEGVEWSTHVQKQHNLINYMYYLIYIERKAATDCDGLQKYVKDQMMSNKIQFLPRVFK